MPSIPVREHPLWDRPLELASGFAYGLAGLVIFATTLFLGEPVFAPRYLAELHNTITLAYAGLTVVGGGLVVTGLVVAYRTDPLFGRYMETIGHTVLVLVTLTYAYDLIAGGFSSPRNTLLLGIFSGRVVGSIFRGISLLRKNRTVRQVIRDVSNGGGPGDR